MGLEKGGRRSEFKIDAARDQILDRRQKNPTESKRASLRNALLAAIALAAAAPTVAHELGSSKNQSSEAKLAQPALPLTKESSGLKRSIEKQRLSDSAIIEKVVMQQALDVHAEDIARAIEAMERGLAPGGEILSELQDINLTQERFGKIVATLSQLSGLAVLVADGVIPMHPSMQKYLLEDTPKGLVSLAIPVRYPDGKTGIAHCGGERVAVEGTVGILTSKHCVSRKDSHEYTAIDYKEWFAHPGNADLAMKPVEASDTEPAMEFDVKAAQYAGGRFALIDSFNRFQSQSKYHAFIIPMTETALRFIYNNEALSPQWREKLLATDWHVAPAKETSRTLKDGKEVGWNFESESGTSPMIHTDSGWVMGGPISMATTGAQCILPEKKLCVSVMYTTPAREVVELFRAYKRDHHEPALSRHGLNDPFVTKVHERTRAGRINTADSK